MSGNIGQIHKATTCNITLTGNNVTNDGNNNYTLRIPKMGLDKIANKTTESQADFKLVASGCSSGISWIDTTLTGNASSSSPKLIIPQSGDSSSTTSNIGMGFKNGLLMMPLSLNLTVRKRYAGAQTRCSPIRVLK